MPNIIYYIFFLLVSIYSLLKSIGYAFYEIKELNNKVGGVSIIIFSIFVVILSNLLMLLNFKILVL